MTLIGTGAGQYLEAQVVALMGADKTSEGDAQTFLEMLLDILKHVGLSGRRETPYRGQLALAGELLNEARNIEVVRSKIRAPFRQAVRFVEDPGTNLTLGNGAPKRLIAKLLRRHQQNAHITELDHLQHLGTLRHGQQAVEGGSALHVPRKQPIDLVLHQGLQRRDDDREGAVAMKTIQGWQLVAQ